MTAPHLGPGHSVAGRYTIRALLGFTGEVATDYIRGLGSVEQRMLILVDIEKLLNTEELAALEAVS